MKTLVSRGLAAVVLLGWAAAFSVERMTADLSAFLSQGPRVAGTPAVAAAGDYLGAQLSAAGYTVEKQSFSYSRTQDKGSSLQLASGPLRGSAIMGSPNGRWEGPLVPVGGVGQASDYTGLQVKGAIVVVRRGGIPFLEKARQAAAQGAIGLVVVNDNPGPLAATYGGQGPIPGLIVSQTQGEALLAQLQTPASGALVVNVVTEEVKGQNVVAKRGSAAPQLIVGGHYDSVVDAPGANDNASGSVTVLELARLLAASPLSERIWFVWFDAEEDGLWGSRRFVEQNPETVKGLKAMLNLDMVGVKAAQAVGLGGDLNLVKQIQTLEPTALDIGRAPPSDNISFTRAGIPAVVFHWGLDPNYHLPGDTAVDVQLMVQVGQLLQRTVETLLGTS